MLDRLRHWAGAGAVLTGLAFGVSAAPGYLPVVGPVPLRFRPAPHSETNLLLMPLPPPDPTPDFPLSAPPTPPAPPATPAPAPSTASPPATNTPAGPEADAAATEPRISTQMLLRYFSRSTNGGAGGIIAPVDFAPPAAASPPSSTATYSTEPK